MEKYVDKLRRAIRKGNYQKAKSHIRLILERDPQASIAYYYKGLIAAQEGYATKALENFRKAIEYDQKARIARHSYSNLYALEQETLILYYMNDERYGLFDHIL